MQNRSWSTLLKEINRKEGFIRFKVAFGAVLQGHKGSKQYHFFMSTLEGQQKFLDKLHYLKGN